MPYISSQSSKINTAAKKDAIAQLVENSSHSVSYYVLLVGAALLAIGGIFIDSIPLVIASMIVAPLAFPILGLGMAISVLDWRLVGRVLILLIVSCGVVLLLAMLSTVFFSSYRVTNILVTFTSSREISFVVAIVSGVIAAYGTLQPRIASAITGIAIAVSLMPPLVATGIGMASRDSSLTGNSASIFGLNILGILIASVIVFVAVRLKTEYSKQ